MHLDSARAFVEEGAVAEQRRVEVGAELAVETIEHVEVELRRDAVGVVVRRVQDARVLPPIDAEQHHAVVAERLPHAREECDRLGGMEVADRRSREETHTTRAHRQRRDVELARVVGAHRADRQGGVVASQRRRDVRELPPRDIHWRVRRGPLQRVEQQPDLYAGTAAVFHQRAARSGERADLRSAGAQDLELGAREVVLRLLADLLEQRGPAIVVEELGRQRLALRAQTAQHLVGECGIGVRLNAGAAQRKPHDDASRIPVNCQRVSDGKKLRYVTRAWPGGVASDDPRSTH